jgi:hypothetical protein
MRERSTGYSGFVVSDPHRLLDEKRSREELTILMLVEPRALDVEQAQSRYEPRQREGIDGKLGYRLVGAGVGLVVEDMYGTVPDLQEVEMAGYRARGVATARRNLDS